MRAVGDRSGEARTLVNVGSVYLLVGEKQKALDYYNQALPIMRAIGDGSGEAATLNNIGNAYDSLGKKQKALDYYNQSLPITRAVGNRSGEAITLGSIAVLNLSIGQLLEARSHVEEALAIVESLRGKISSDDLRTSYFSSQIGYYVLYVDILMQLHRLHPAEGYDRLAFEASEKGKARSLLDLLNEAEAHIYRGADPKLLEREATIRQQLDTQAQLKTKLLNGLHPPQQLSELEQRLRELTTQYEQVESEIRQKSPQYAALTQPHPASVNETQQHLLDSDIVLLEYALGEERSYLWLVTPTTFTSYELPKAQDINQAARQAYSLLTARVQRRVQADKEYEKRGCYIEQPASGESGFPIGSPTVADCRRRRFELHPVQCPAVANKRSGIRDRSQDGTVAVCTFAGRP